MTTHRPCPCSQHFSNFFVAMTRYQMLLLFFPAMAFSWTVSSRSKSLLSQSQRSVVTLQMNLFDDIGAALSGGKLVSQTSLPYSPPLCPSSSVSNRNRIFAIQERAISFTGEDFDVCDAESRAEFCKVRGAMLHLPGKDKMRVSTASGEVAVLDRVLMAVTPTYDIYRQGEGEKLGWIEKKVISLTDAFDVYLEGNGGFGVTGLFKPPPAFRLEGDFIDRNFVMKNSKNELVAKICKDGLIQFDAFNHYQVQVAEGMDAMLVVACLCAVDEEFDEEHKKSKEERENTNEGKGGWF